MKENIKLFTSAITCLFAIIQLFFLSSCSYRKKHHSFLAILIIFSILLCPFATNYGMSLIAFFIPELDYLQIRTLFKVNPLHLKHIISFYSFILALVLIIEIILSKKNQNEITLSKWTLLFFLFNTFTARPLLHIAGQLIAAL